MAKPKRRKFTAQYRLRILEEAESCTQPGEVGRLLRRERLYSSHLTEWRRARREGSLQGLTPSKRGRKPAERNPLSAKVHELEAKVARLEKELHTAHAAAPAIRMDVLVEYRPRLAFEGRTNFLEPGRRQSVAAELSSLSGMLAGYVDLPGLGLAKIGPFGPFVGAGVGAVRTRIGEMRMTFPRTTTVVPGAGRTGLAWMLTAGVAVALGERATLDLAWRYTDLGEVRTGRGAGRVVWRDGSREPLPLDLAETRL